MPQKITQTERNAIEVELTENEIELLTDAPEEPIRKIAIGLMAKCGLRVGETVRVSPDDIISSSGGNPYIQVESRGKTREVPLPHGLHTDIRDYVDEHQTGSTESIVDRSERTVSRWVKEAAEECYEETGDETWLDLSTRNLRGSWIRLLITKGVHMRKIGEISGIDTVHLAGQVKRDGIEKLE